MADRRLKPTRTGWMAKRSGGNGGDDDERHT